MKGIGIMKKHTKLYLLGTAVLFWPLLSIAASAEGLAEMPKNEWLGQIKSAVPVPICKSFIEDETISAQMTAHNISYDKCVSLIPAIAEKCQQKYYASLPPTMNRENAEKWGRLIGECIGNGFAMDYLSSGFSGGMTDAKEPLPGQPAA